LIHFYKRITVWGRIEHYNKNNYKCEEALGNGRKKN